jgi:hypothetical protein
MRTRTLLILAAGLLLLPVSGCCLPCGVCLVDDTATTLIDEPVVIDVLANDKIGSTATINSVTTLAVSQGSAVVNTDNTITYTPELGATGEATFEYQVCYTCEGGKCSNSSSTEETCQTALVTVTIEDVTAEETAEALAATTATAESQSQEPASVLLVNNSNFEITVSVGGQEVDVVQPLGSTVVPAEIASGDQSVEVEALLPDPDPARVTSSSFNFAPTGQYTVTYTDDNVSPASISVAETP